jgi:hypothetical protein
MGVDFYVLRFDTKLQLIVISRDLSEVNVEIHLTRDLVDVGYFELFDNAIWVLRWDDGTKEEGFLFNREDVGVEHFHHLVSGG